MSRSPAPTPLLPARSVIVRDAFISPAECASILRELDHSYWHSSAIINKRTGRVRLEVQERYRGSTTSHQEWFSARLNATVRRIERRLAKQFGCDPSALEPWQATRYEKGGRFDYHVDGGSWKTSPAGERKRTYLLYLVAPDAGGETHFRALDILVRPEPGRLVAWTNLLPSGDCDYGMIHAGLPVRRGTKTTLVTWERQRPLRKEGTHGKADD